MCVTPTFAIHRRLPASRSAVPRLRRIARCYAADCCGLDTERVELVALAVTEAAANVVQHAYRGEPGIIEFVAEARDGELLVMVADSGVGVDEPSPNRGLGAGLRIMRGLTETRIASQPDIGTFVELRFPLSGRRS